MREKRSRGGAVVASPFRRFIMIVILLVLIFAVFIANKILNNKKLELAKKTIKINELQIEIEKEEEKAKNLDKTNNQVNSDDDVEALARQELGLIKKDEIVIKPR